VSQNLENDIKEYKKDTEISNDSQKISIQDKNVKVKTVKSKSQEIKEEIN